MPHQLSPRTTAYILLAINTLCWGAAMVAVKPSLEHITPFRFLLYRFVLSSLLALPLLVYYFRKLRAPLHSVARISVLELLGTTGLLSLLYFGLQRTTAIEASLLSSTAPLFVVLAGVLLLREREEKREAIGLLIAFLATLALAAEPLLSGVATTEVSLVGNLLILCANLAAALYYVTAKRTYAQIPKFFVTAVSFVVGFATFLLLSLFEFGGSLDSFWQQVLLDWQHQETWIAAGYMAFFGSIIGLTAYIKGQDLIEASEASVFTYLQPLVGIPLGVFLLSEPVTLWQLLALGGILAGVAVAEHRQAPSERTYRTRRKKRANSR